MVPAEGREVEHPVGVQPGLEDANSYNLGQPAQGKRVTQCCLLSVAVAAQPDTLIVTSPPI